MLYIVLEESQGFGGGGWEIGYYIHLIRKGKVINVIRTDDLEPTLGVLKLILKEYGIKYEVRKVVDRDDDFCKQLIKVLRKETEGDKE